MLEDVGFELVPGELTALIGANGAGKSTLLGCISGVQVPDEGTVLLDGIEVTRWPPHRRARLGLSTVFQATAPFHGLSVWESTRVGCHRWTRHGFLEAMVRAPRHLREEGEIARSSREALEKVGLWGRSMDEVDSLPFGQQRLLAVARAIAANPHVLMLDEPAAGLRAQERGRLVDVLLKLRGEGLTQLLVEHDVALVMQVSDRVVVLDRGRVIADGPPSKIRANKRVIAAYLGETWGL